MPTYQYYCDDCKESFEARRRFTDGPLTSCPEGHEGSLRRIFEPAGIIFKGSGWYTKDSKSSDTASTNSSPTSKKSKEPDSGSAPTTESDSSKSE